MNRNEIKLKLLNILTSLFSTTGFDADILEYADLIDDFGMDSITFISIVIDIESVFEITVPDHMLFLENFRNVDGIIEIIEYAKNVDEENISEQEAMK